MLDSINLAMKQKYGLRDNPENANAPYKHASPGASQKDKSMAEALNGLYSRHKEGQVNNPSAAQATKEKDPMEMFKLQMAYIDSVNKANDPAVKAEKLKKETLAKAEALHPKETALKVRKAEDNESDFNTILPGKRMPLSWR